MGLPLPGMAQGCVVSCSLCFDLRPLLATSQTFRHLQVADFSDTVNRIPPEELQAGMGGGMVAAPEDLQRQLEAELAQLQERYRLGGAPLYRAPWR